MIKQTYKIDAPVDRVWDALTKPRIIKQWSGRPASMSDHEGAEFKLWDGDIWGTNTKVEKNHFLEQDWYGGKWPAPSKLSIELAANNNSTTIYLTHRNIPAIEERNFATGWEDYYFGPMKQLLES